MPETDTQPKRLRVLLVDDSSERRTSVERSLAEVGCEVVGFASSRDNLVQCVGAANPDVVIMDIESPSRDTLDSLRSMQSSAPRPIVMFTQDDNGATITRATRAGVSAYVVDGISQKRVRPILDAAIERFVQYRELSPDNWAACVREQLNAGDTSAEWRELYDSTQIQYRAARIIGGRLDAVIIIGPGFELPPRDWLAALFRKQRLDDSERARLLRATPPSGQEDAGAIVCACFSVGVGTLRRAICEQGLDSPEAIGRALHAGTNCGSCVAELRRLIADAAAQPVA